MCFYCKGSSQNMSNNILLHGRWVRLAAQAPFDFALVTGRPSVIDVEQRRTIIIIKKNTAYTIPIQTINIK